MSDAAEELYREIRNGLVTQMSFCFEVLEWGREEKSRTVKRIGKVFDVSAVGIPANPMTEIEARSLMNSDKNLKRRIALLRLELEL